MTASDFVDMAKKMRRYRDKFVAHLDSDPKMDIPLLKAALAADSFYHGQIVRVEAAAGDLFGLADTSDKFAKGYEQCIKKPSGPMLKRVRAAMSRLFNVRQSHSPACRLNIASVEPAHQVAAENLVLVRVL
jgi:hypothetical protein